MPPRQVAVRQAAAGRAKASEIAGGGRGVAGRLPQPAGPPPLAAVGLGRQRHVARGPEARRAHDAGDVGEAQAGQRVAQGGVGAAAGVHHHRLRPRHPGGEGRLDLAERDRRLGGEADLLRHAGPATPFRVLGPPLRQVEPPGDRQARRGGGDREADRDLAVVLLAELPAVLLPGDADRVPALLGDAGVVDDPGLRRAAAGGQARQRPIPHRGEHGPVVPRRLGGEVVHRLVRGAAPTRRGASLAAIGSTLLRSPGSGRPVQYARSGPARSACPSAPARRWT
jgi:hypothetical protein